MGRERIVRWLSTVVVGAWLLGWSASAWATTVRVDVPPGWTPDGAAHPEAITRARGWTQALRGDLTHVHSTQGEDGFAETLAVIEVPTALQAFAFQDLELTRRTAQPVLRDLGLTEAEVRLGEVPGAPAALASFAAAGTTTEVAIVPTGSTYAVVLLATRTEEASLYHGVFTRALASLSGAAVPISPFAHERSRWFSLFLWLVLAIGSYVAIDRAAPEGGMIRRNLRLCAGVLAALAPVLGGGAFLLVRGQTAALALAGLSPEWIGLEVALVGLGLAVLALVLGELLGRSHRIVSAPTSGAYSRGQASFSGTRLYDNEGVSIIKVDPSASRSSGERPVPGPAKPGTRR